MRLKVKIEGYIDLDEEQIEFLSKQDKNLIEERLNDMSKAIQEDIENYNYLKIKNISVEEESKT